MSVLLETLRVVAGRLWEQRSQIIVALLTFTIIIMMFFIILDAEVKKYNEVIGENCTITEEFFTHKQTMNCTQYYTETR